EPVRDPALIEHLDGARLQATGARSVECLTGPPLDDGHVRAGQGQLARQHQAGRTAAGDHHRMPGHGRAPSDVRMTSSWVARVIATYRSTAPSIPVPNVSGSTSTTRSNSSPLASTGVSDLTRGVAGKAGAPMTQATPSPSACAASHPSMTWPRSDAGPCRTGMPP